MAEIFISYAREDYSFVNSLSAALEFVGHVVWFDRELNVGEFREQIANKLAAADVVIVVWSERSRHSRYVTDEAERAAARGVLLPVRLDASDLPLGFGVFQTFDLSHWSGAPDDANFKLLWDQIETIRCGVAHPQRRPPVRFAAKSLGLAVAVATACAPVLAYLNVIKQSESISSLRSSDIVQAFALSFVLVAPVMLWCGFRVSRFNLSHASLVLRRALRTYALSAILGLIMLVAAVAGGATEGLQPTAAFAQLAFVAILATLVMACVIAFVRSATYLARQYRRT